MGLTPRWIRHECGHFGARVQLVPTPHRDGGQRMSSGDVDLTSCRRLQPVIDVAFSDSNTRVTVDLAGVTSITEPAMWFLVDRPIDGRAKGFQLVFRSPSAGAMNVIDRAGLADLLPSKGPRQAGRAARSHSDRR